MKTILIISYSVLKIDPRIQRQIETLKKTYKISTLGFGPSGHPEINEYQIAPIRKRDNKYKDAFLLLGRFFDFYYDQLPYISETRSVLKGKKFDLIIANDIEALPVALDFSPESKIWYDAHEYSPRENEDSLQWRIFFAPFKTYLCKKYLKKANFMTTVCDGIAMEYMKQFNRKEVEVVRNSPPFYDLTPSLVKEDKISFIHHGAAIRGRKIENMIHLMKLLDKRFNLNLMLIPTDPEYLLELKSLSSNLSNISFLEPVSMTKIPEFINQYDLGIYFLEPLNFNQKFALPNKIFEFLQARLGIIIGPSPEMAKIVSANGLGLVTESFDMNEISHAINSLTTDSIKNFKLNSHKAASSLSFESDSKLILQLIEKVFRN